MFDQARQRVEGLLLVRAASLDQYRAADARGEEHDGENVPRVCRAPLESERDATAEPRGEVDDLRGEPRMEAEAVGYVDVTCLHAVNDRTHQRR
jgi:hypothetical protein